MNSIIRLDAASQHEVDLIAVGKAIWKHARLVGVVGLICACIAALYAFTAAKKYEVTSILRPVAMNELDALNLSDVYKLSPKDALMNVAASLESYETRLGFYRERPNFFDPFRSLGRSEDQVFDYFNKEFLKLSLPNVKEVTANTYIGLKLLYPESVDGVRLLNELVAYAIEAERRQVAADVEAVIENRIAVLEGRLRIARAAYEQEKQSRIAKLLELDSLKRVELQDELRGLRLQLRAQRSARIAQLDEAISIARSLGIEKPTTPSALGGGEVAAQGNIIRTEVNNQQIPLYFMGADALLAERKALRQRSNDDFSARRIAEIAKELEMLKNNREVEMLRARENEDLFLKDVESHRAELNRLRNLSLNLDKLKLVSIDRQAMEPIAPVSPRKALIIFAGFVAGLVLGVIMVAVRHLVSSHRRLVQGIDALQPANTPLGASEAA